VACPRGHHLDETVGDEGPAIGVSSFVCQACGAEDSARRQAQRDVESAGGADAADLLDGRYFVATVGDV
jgi:hypothetical protein